MRTQLLLTALAAEVALIAPAGSALDLRGARADFQREVRPILADRCFRCHGPDPGERKRGLRLDREEGSRALLRSGARAIVPGSLEESELVARIRSEDPREIMPPPSLGRPLSEEEKEILARWVAEGGEYEPHWAFVPPKRSEAPAVREEGWVRDPLDRYVLARLEALGLAPSPEAEPATLLRRASLVTTGLPPDPLELARFLKDPSPEAYERAVDRLLDSPHYGEHQAAVWLDLARYADTYGYQADQECETWPWRDWLIGALQRDLPYDRFASELLAGDLLPGATREQVLATAFLRLHRMTNEGGSIDEEFRQEGVADRVATFGTAFLGLSVECARCHDHKYDPIEQREFFSLAAFLGAIDEAGTYAHSHRSAPPPALALPTPEEERRLAELERGVAEAWERLERALDQGRALLTRMEREAPPLEVLPPVRFEALEGGIEGPRGSSSHATGFDGDSGLSLEGVPAFRRSDPFSLVFWMRCEERLERATLLHTSPFTIESDPQGYQALILDGRLAWQLVHFWPGSAAAVRTQDELPLGRWLHVALTYDGSSRAGGLSVFLDGRRAPLSVDRDQLEGVATARLFQLGFRDRDKGFAGGALAELSIFDRELSLAEVRELHLPGSGAASEALESWFQASDPDLRAARAELARAREERNELADGLRRIPVLAATRHPRPVFVLRRGAYDDPDPEQPVESDRAIEALLPFDPGWPRDRSGLARWLLDPRHPLTARVQVNRLWMGCFGRGLLASQENFGLQGGSPSHPELLDALALHFAEGGYRSRPLLRRILLSATFRQSSRAEASLRERDPENALLARGPAFRLSAEMLRDQALHASGLLVPEVGGPSVRPWQPPGLWEEAGATGSYLPDSGDRAHRRSLYTFRKRTSPPPNLLVFDAGSRESCLARRSATSTPLQSLVLLNDPVYVECARELACLARREVGSVREQVELAIRRVAAREPRPAETDALLSLYQGELERYRADPETAEPELAALTLVASTLFASDAAVMLR